MDILNEKIEGLVKKAEKSGMPYSILKKVYDRGMAAWKTGHRPGTTPQQWAFARVNSFVTKSSGTWGKADADLAKQVRGEEVERRTTAKSMLGQVREKLDKDSDAGDYVKDFRKSDAPQFKGKSDKKKQKMAIAAYLDSKEEVDLEERSGFKMFSTPKSMKRQLKDPKKEAMVMKVKDSGSIMVIDKKDLEKYLSKGYIQVEDNIQEALKFKYAVVDTSKNNEVVAMSSDEKDMQDTMRRRKERSLKVVKLKRPTKNDNMIGYPLKEEKEIQEQIKTLNTNSLTTSDQLKLAIHFDKLSKDRQVPPENQKAYTAVSDYLRTKTDKRDFDNVMKKTSAMHKQDIEIEMSRIIGKSKTKKVIESKENMQESGHTDVASMKTQVQIAKDALEKMNTELGKLSDEEDLPTWWTNKVATAVGKLDGMADYIDAKSDQGQKMNEEYKSLNESAIGCLQAAMIDNNKSLKEEKVFVVRFEKEGMRFAVPFSDMKRAKDGEKILKKSAGVSNVSVTKDVLKPGVKFKRTQEGKINIDKEYVANPMVERKVTATVNDLTDRKFQKAQLMKDLRADAKKMSRDAFVKKNSYRVKPDALAVMWNALNEELEEKTTKDVDETLDKIREANVAKQKSMREILADIWNMNEGKNPFEKKEGFASDAQRKAAFASGYKEKGKKKKEEVEKDGKTATGQKPTKVEIEPEVK